MAKTIARILCTAAFLYGQQLVAQTLPPLQPEQDACGALTLCNGRFQTPFSYRGRGQLFEQTPSAGPAPACHTENNSVWIRMEVATAGSIVFVISPVDPTDDYDFTIYNLTGVNCAGKIDETTRVRSNGNTIFGSNALVGLNTVSLEDFVQGGTIGHNFLRAIQASAGDVYYLLIDNFVNTSISGFAIDFAGSTATFKGKTQPRYEGVTSICDSNAIGFTIHLTEPIACSSIAADGSDFRLVPAAAGVMSAAGINCSGGNGYTRDIRIGFSRTLPRGNYVLKPVTGSDGNTLVDLCGQPQLLADEQPFKAGAALQVNIGADTVFCPGTRFLLQARFQPAGTAIQTYAWKPAAAFMNASAAMPQFIATANTAVSVEVTTVNGCTAASPVKRINRGRFPVVDAGPEVRTPAGLPVQLQGWVDDPMAVISWSPANGVSNARSLTPLARSLQKRWYYLTATNQAGCSSYDSVWVNAYRLEVPNVFSPNGDGIHDLWAIPELKAYTGAVVEVFSRWGQPVYHSTGYNKPWDGSFAGSPLPAGVYYYIVNPNIMGYDPFTGSITLIR